MTVPLPALLGILAGAFLAINLVFAVIYSLTGGLGGVQAGTFWGGFFFSVQTLSTTGYGAVFPVTILANFISGTEILMGLLSTALATGILFARLSRPRPRVLFSRVIVIKPYQGVPSLMFRIVNERRNQIAEAHLTVAVTRDEVDEAGSILRRFHNLKLERDSSPVFSLSWVVIHKITEDSPFYGKEAAELTASGNVIVCSFTGIDDMLNANIYARYVYGPEDLRFGHRFVDVISRKENGGMSIDYSKFHDTIAE